ncbi:YmfQ family protein [Acidisoma sp. 7E03]
MSRTQDQVLDEIYGTLPEGDGWPGRGSQLLKLFAGLAACNADLEASAESMALEIDPRSAVHLLEDFERCLGPDPFGRDAGALTVEQRALLAYQRWTSRGGLSVPYFIALAAALGVTVSIEEFTRNVCGRMRCGSPLRPHPNQFIWRVTMPESSVTTFRTGISRAGQALGRIARNTLVETAFQALKPPYTEIVFNYSGAA